MKSNNVVKYLDVKELWDNGLLFEINRRVLHPLGLALEVSVSEDGRYSISGVWDCSDDPEGIAYDEETFEYGLKKFTSYMEKEGNDKLELRKSILGYVVQGTKE